MNVVLTLFGEGDDLTSLQMGFRAFTLYLVALVLIRISGMRTFGKKSTFDNVVAILLGAVLSRAIVGASPFFATITAGLTLVSLHRLLAWLSLRYDKFGKLVKGKEWILYSNGKFYAENMRKCFLTDGDLLESIKLHANTTSFENIKEIYMERSGRVSVIKMDKNIPNAETG